MSSNSWATFDGDLQTKSNLWVSGTAHINSLTIVGCLSTDCLSPNTVSGTINTYGNLALHNFNITGVNNLITTNLTASNLTVNNLTAINELVSYLNVSNCLSTDCISPYTASMPVSVHGSINMLGYSISGSGNITPLDNTYSLGSPILPWESLQLKNAYLTGNIGASLVVNSGNRISLYSSPQVAEFYAMVGNASSVFINQNWGYGTLDGNNNRPDLIDGAIAMRLSYIPKERAYDAVQSGVSASMVRLTNYSIDPGYIMFWQNSGTTNYSGYQHYFDPSGNFNVQGSVLPLLSGTYNLGSSAMPWNIINTKDISFNNSTVVTAVTSTGQFLTLTVNGSARAIPLYTY